MKRFSGSIVAILICIEGIAQSCMNVHLKSGNIDCYDIEKIDSITFTDIESNIDQNYANITKIIFSDPIEIMSNKDCSSSYVDDLLINEYNIVKYGDYYYMYYIAIGKNTTIADANYNLCFAYSSDCKNWIRAIPSKENTGNNAIAKGIVEQSVFIVDDMEYPFRLIGNLVEDGQHQMYLWKSKNGVDFVDKQIMLTDTWHDTQNSVTLHEGGMKMYTRVWNPQATNRRIGVCYFDMEGEQTSVITTLAGDYLYNAAPCRISEQYDLILPTFMNNKEGRNDDCYLKSYLVDGYFVKEISNNMAKLVAKDVKWVSCCPGFIEIEGDKYVGIITWNWSHDTPMPADGVVKYYISKVTFE